MSLLAPTLSNFSIPTKQFGDSSFNITDPSSNSTGYFSYTSSNTSVATVTNIMDQYCQMHYKFNSTDLNNGKFLNYATNSYDATLVSGASLDTNTYKIGNGSINLTGSNSYLSLPTFQANINGLSFSFWMLRTTIGLPIWSRMFEFGINSMVGNNNISLFNRGSGANRMLLSLFNDTSNTYGDIALDININNGLWHHIVWTLTYSTDNSSTWRLYVDNVLQYSGGNKNYPYTNILFNTNYLAKSIKSDPYYRGSIDDFRVYNRVLNASEVSDLYNYKNNTVTIVGPGTTTITATQAATTNYLSGYITASLTVKDVPIITNFSNITKAYGDASFIIIDPSSNSDGSFNFTVPNNNGVATINGNVVTILGAGTVTIIATQQETNNYLSTTITANLIVNKGVPTITNFTIPQKTYGDASFTLIDPSSNSSGSFTFTVPNNNGIATINGNVVTIVGGGTLTITATQNSTTNYLSRDISANLIVNRKAPTITNFYNITKIYGIDTTFILNPISDSDGSFNFTCSNGIISISGNNVTINSAGTATITATQQQTQNYELATRTIQLTIQKKYPAIIFNNKRIRKLLFGSDWILNNPISDSNGSFNYTSSNPNAVTIEQIVTNGITYYKLNAVGVGTSKIEITQSETNSHSSRIIKILTIIR